MITCCRDGKQIDLFATFADLLGAEIPDDAAEDSRSMLPLLRGKSDAVRDAHVHNTNADHYAVRQGDWVLVDAKTGYVSARSGPWEEKHGYAPDDQSPVELYNLLEDIGQRKNVAAEHPERVKSMQKLLKTIREKGHWTLR